MARDPKLGYHRIWLYPAFYLTRAVQHGVAMLSRTATRIMSKINDLRYPRLKDLRTLAGIKDGRKQK